MLLIGKSRRENSCKSVTLIVAHAINDKSLAENNLLHIFVCSFDLRGAFIHNVLVRPYRSRVFSYACNFLLFREKESVVRAPRNVCSNAHTRTLTKYNPPTEPSFVRFVICIQHPPVRLSAPTPAVIIKYNIINGTGISAQSQTIIFISLRDDANNVINATLRSAPKSTASIHKSRHTSLHQMPRKCLIKMSGRNKFYRRKTRLLSPCNCNRHIISGNTS